MAQEDRVLVQGMTRDGVRIMLAFIFNELPKSELPEEGVITIRYSGDQGTVEVSGMGGDAANTIAHRAKFDVGGSAPDKRATSQFAVWRSRGSEMVEEEQGGDGGYWGPRRRQGLDK